MVGIFRLILVWLLCVRCVKVRVLWCLICSLCWVCVLWCDRLMCRCSGWLVVIGLVDIVFICMFDNCRCVLIVLVMLVVFSSRVSSSVGLLL